MIKFPATAKLNSMLIVCSRQSERCTKVPQHGKVERGQNLITFQLAAPQLKFNEFTMETFDSNEH